MAWGEGWDHDIRHIDLLRAKKPCVSPPEAPMAGRPWAEGRLGDERRRAWGRDRLPKDLPDPTPPPWAVYLPSGPSWEEEDGGGEQD